MVCESSRLLDGVMDDSVVTGERALNWVVKFIAHTSVSILCLVYRIGAVSLFLRVDLLPGIQLDLAQIAIDL